ncbi:LysR family transcriptional regulator [Pseudochrobactrum sp. B5]|uniref:LysR family transcriptional regulator n=1 Tax=Pseudochrobactrum sp. B5 TaxID=1289478 RepID=UPI000951133E|nr:LysR family transcriptional regulator [Pseudochrobactrum sp. B5]
MNIRFLETVIWLSELRNFRITAARMNMTPAAISNRIGAIEQELGFRLFERDARDVSLTAEGEVFVEGARDIVLRYHNLVESVSPKNSVEGQLKLGIVPSLAMTILPDVLDILRQRYPKIRISITTDSSKVLTQQLEQRELDIVFAIRPDTAATLRSVNICTFGMFWISRTPDVLISPEDLFSREDLLNYPIISYERGAHNHQQIINYFSEDRIKDATVHYSNSLTTTINMISAGVGISVLPPVVIQKELRQGELKVLNTNTMFPATNYSAMYLEASATRLITLVATIAREAGRNLCNQYSDNLAYQEILP